MTTKLKQLRHTHQHGSISDGCGHEDDPEWAVETTPGRAGSLAAHAPHEHYLTLSQIRQSCAKILPGAQVGKHLFWRYSIVWKKMAIQQPLDGG